MRKYTCVTVRNENQSKGGKKEEEKSKENSSHPIYARKIEV